MVTAWFLLLLAAAPAPAAAGEEPSPEGDRIVVTATRTESDAAELPFTVHEVSGESWSQAGGKPEAALASVPGASFTANGGPGQTRSLLLRGAFAQHTLVLIDGIPANDPLSPSRSFDFGQIPASQIDRIEIIEGPQSVLYGSDALGGVVQIFTRKDKNGLARVEGGSYNTWSFQAAGLGFRAGYETSRGFSAADSRQGNTEPDGYHRWNLGGRQDVPLGDRAVARLSALYAEAKTDTDANGGRGGDSTGTGSRGSQLLFRDENVILLPRDFRLTVAGSLAARHRDDNTNGSDYYRSTGWKAESLLQKSLGPHGLTAGGEYSEEAGSSSQIPGYRRFRAGALYLQDQAAWGRFHAVAGGRLDFHSETETAPTFRLGIGYWLAPELLRARASLGTGFKAPSLYQTYSIYGSRSLRPEKSIGGDAGLEYTGEEWSSSLVWFQSSFRDLIDTQTLSVGPPLVVRYYNLRRAETYGAEWVLERRLGLFRLGNSLTTLRAVDLGTRLPLYRRPRLSDTLRAGFRKGDFVGCNLLLRYVGRRDDVEPATGTRQPMPPFTTLGFDMFHQIGSGLRATGRVENLLNRPYQETSGYGTPGLSAYAGVEADL